MGEPSIVKKEFGLLNAGLFNKIRFPGRFQVDESGNKIINSEYNAGRIDFTGDLAELYVEPDTFFLEPGNELYMRKRKRDEDGNVIETKRLKVGQLDITAVGELASQFLSAQEQRNVIDNVISDEFERLKNALRSTDASTSALNALATALQTNQENLVVDRDRLSQALVDEINSFYNENQVRNVVETYAYSRGEVDREITDAFSNLNETQGANVQQLADSIRRTFATVNESTDRSFAGLRSTLTNLYVPLSIFENTVNGLVSRTDLLGILPDYLGKDEYEDDVNNRLATRTFVNDTFSTKTELSDRLGQAVQQLTDSQDFVLEDFNQSLQSALTLQEFPTYLARYIPGYEDVVRNERLEAVRQFILADIQGVSRRIDQTANTMNAMRSEIEEVDATVREYYDEFGKKIQDTVNFNTEQSEGIEALLTELFSDLRNDVTDNNTFRTGATPLLGLGTDPDARTFAYRSEVEPIDNRVGTINDVEIPNLSQRITNLFQSVQDFGNQIDTRQLFADTNYVNKNNQDDINLLAAAVQQEVVGYTKSQTDSLINGFYDRNFKPTKLYPVKRLWAECQVSKGSISFGDMGYQLQLTNFDRVDVARNTTFEDQRQKIQLGPVVNQSKEPGVDYQVDISDLLTTLSGFNREFFTLYQNKKEIFLKFPRQVVTEKYQGTTSSDARKASGSSMRFSYHIVDHTPASKSATYPTPSPVMYYTQTIQDYSDTDMGTSRIDRIVPMRPWKTGANSEERFPGSKLKFDLIIECAPDIGDFQTGTVG